MKSGTIECKFCGWTGEDEYLICPWNNSEPCCPECGSSEFLETKLLRKD